MPHEDDILIAKQSGQTFRFVKDLTTNRCLKPVQKEGIDMLQCMENKEDEADHHVANDQDEKSNA